MELKDFIKELEAIKQENEQLKRVKERTASLSEKVDQAIGILLDVKKELDPASTIKLSTGRKPKNPLFSEALEELGEKLVQNGLEIDRMLIEKTYPELDWLQHSQLLAKLQNIPGVTKERIVVDNKSFVRLRYKGISNNPSVGTLKEEVKSEERGNNYDQVVQNE